jgi:hypothetical protein
MLKKEIESDLLKNEPDQIKEIFAIIDAEYSLSRCRNENES